MLGSKEKGNSSFGGSNTTTLISRGTEVVGDILFSGNVDIEGVVRGNIVAQTGTEAVVRVVDKGRVEGEIRAPSVIINGEIAGDVYSSKHLELAAKAKVDGNVYYAQVEMAIGAQLNGSLKHSPEQQPSKQAGKQAPKPAAGQGMAESSAALKT
jgi:cytoskeletal protein CcmA (bactofilin family)